MLFFLFDFLTAFIGSAKVGKHIDMFVDIYVTSYEYKNFSNTDFYPKNPLFFIREEKVKTLLKGKA